MNKFVMTEELEKVKDKETQALLEEVISCYSNGNYRAAIVTLYTTMIYDLLSKINVLSNYYDVQQAKDLMVEISTQKINAPKSPQWEETLLKGIKNINLVTSEEFDELENLKTNRNYSAHPIVSLKSDNTIDYFEIKNISRETAADMIRKAFEIVFLRDPVIAININQKIEKDIKNFYDTNGIIGLEDYLYTRYISKMTNKPKEMLFKFLWKMSFIKDDFEYKQAYVTSLIALCKSDVSYFSNYLKNHTELFEKIEPENLTNIEEYKKANLKNDYEVDKTVIIFKNNSRLVNLIYFLEKLPDFMATLNDYIKSILYDESRHVLRNIFLDSSRDIYNTEVMSPKKPEIEQIKLFAEHLYGIDDIKNHFNEIGRLSAYIYEQSIFDKEMIERMYIQASYFGYKKELTEELIKNIAKAGSYAEADDLLENIPTLKRYFDSSDCISLLEEISHNNQFTGNRNYNRIKEKLQ
ncbi:MAG: hypothetical protein U0K68_14390 [Agathobacter sp.]|nr:hypothetical protein [Agathobacter sp.]